MQTGLAGDVVAVLGAAGGIGAAIAKAFAVEGCAVALVDRSPRVESLATALHDAHGVPARAFVVDATDYPALQVAARSAVEQLGPCQHVVVSIGVGSGKFGMPFWSLDPADWDAVWRANLMSCVHAAHCMKLRTAEAEAVDYETWAAEKIRRVAPLGRWQTAQDVAGAAVFLASRLADNVTGQAINVDGGQVMHS